MACRSTTDRPQESDLLQKFLSKSCPRDLAHNDSITTSLLTLFRRGFSVSEQTTCRDGLGRVWPALVTSTGTVLQKEELSLNNYLQQALDQVPSVQELMTRFTTLSERSTVFTQVAITHLYALFDLGCTIGEKTDGEMNWPQLVTKRGCPVPIGTAPTLEAYLKIVAQAVQRESQDERIQSVALPAIEALGQQFAAMGAGKYPVSSLVDRVTVLPPDSFLS